MKKKLQQGKALEELVKGSLQYTLEWIRSQFRSQFPYSDMGPNYYIVDAFSDYVVVETYSDSDLMPSEFYKVTFTKSGETYTFAAKDQWEIVELAYQPQTTAKDVAVMETGKSNSKKKGKRFEETIVNSLQLVESNDQKPEGPWRVKGIGITADTINGNGRRYPAKVLEAAIKELNGHLHESAGQGRVLSLTGESDHPTDKGNRRPLLSETVINWDRVDFDGKQVLIEGNLLGTSKGKDIHAQMLGGVIPGISQRAYGTSKVVKENGGDIEEVQQLIITGYDMTAPNEQSDPNGSINYFESQSSMEDDMNLLEELKKLLAEHPELFGKGMTEAQLAKMSEDALTKIDESIRAKLGIDANADIAKALNDITEKARKYDEAEKAKSLETAITEATKELPYGDEGNKLFVESVREMNPQDVKAVKSIVESQRKLFDKVYAGKKLEGMGFKGKIQKVQPVLEAETGVPEFARASFELVESISRSQMRERRDLRKAITPAEILTVQILERFDKLYQHQLINEAKLFQEAELTTDLNLPYAVSRAIIEEAFPSLVAANIFDTGVIDTSPTKLFYETFAGESGYTNTVTDEEVVAGAADEWVALDYGRITPGTVVVTTDPAGTTYVENVDFVIDHAAGRIKILAAGEIDEDDALLVDYGYTAIRKGEMAPIERAKNTLASKTVEAAADRLADALSREAVVFSRSQLGYDAVTRTLANLIRNTQRKIDQGMLYMALAAVRSVASNTGGEWTSGTTQDDYDELVRLIGLTKLKLVNRFYPANYILSSFTNAEVLSNWDGFKRDGFPNAVMSAAGFAGGVKGLPIFASTEFPDDTLIVGSRELVMYRVFQPMIVKGPFPTYATTGDVTRLVAADQYYTEEFNVTESPVEEKGAYLTIAEGS